MKKLQLTGLQLKLIALTGMIIDHINTHFGETLGFPILISWIGRFVAPIFLYLLMEGFIHTSNRSKYFTRLCSIAFLMFLINLVKNIVTTNYYNPATKEFDVFLLLDGNNIFLTLACFFLIFTLVEKIKTNSTNRIINIIFFIGMVFITCMTEGGLYLLPLGIGLAWSNNSKKVATWVLLLSSILLLTKSLLGYYTSGYTYTNLYSYLGFENQFMQWLAIPLILIYNGLRGGTGKKWEKNLFYIIYPVHLVIISIIEYLIR